MEELIRSWPNRERALHYAERAAKLREIAEAETGETMREQLLKLADQYTHMMDRLLIEQPPWT